MKKSFSGSPNEFRVEGLSLKVSREKLEEAFSPYGTLTRCQIVNQGSAYIGYSTRDATLKAYLCMHGNTILQRKLLLTLADPSIMVDPSVTLWFSRLPKDLLRELQKYIPMEMAVILAHLPQFPCPAQLLRDAHSRLCVWAAREGYLGLMKWAILQGSPFFYIINMKARRTMVTHFYAAEGAAAGGHLDILKYLQQEGHLEGEKLVYAAGEGGNIELLDWLFDNYMVERFSGNKYWQESSRCVSYLSTSAASAGKLEVLKWMKLKGFTISVSEAADAASTNGRLEILKYLSPYDDPNRWDPTWIEIAAKLGHMDILKWAYESEYPFSEKILEKAAEGNRTEAFAWGVSKGIRPSSYCCIAAASNGNLAILKLARAHGCPLDERVCGIAASRKDDEMLKWALAEGFPWDPEKDRLRAEREREEEEERWAHSF